MTHRLDLGAGLAPKEGFVAVDRFLLPGITVVLDIAAPYLPFLHDSFDVIHAFHALEHVADLMRTMREVWRVGRAGAQVCIVAPYYTMGLNLANPYHRQAFNEHTPRFWNLGARLSRRPRRMATAAPGRDLGSCEERQQRPGIRPSVLSDGVLLFRGVLGPARRCR